MLKEVEEKIQDLHQQQKDEYYRQKDIDLENWGLSQKKNGKNSAPIIVTDDEYEALVNASAGISSPSRNPFATMLNIGAVVILTLAVVAGIASVVLIDDLGIVYMSAIVIGGLLLALLFRGVSEAINLLQHLIDMRRSDDFQKMHENKQVFPEQQPIAAQAYKNAPPIHVAYPAENKTFNMPQ